MFGDVGAHLLGIEEWIMTNPSSRSVLDLNVQIDPFFCWKFWVYDDFKLETSPNIYHVQLSLFHILNHTLLTFCVGHTIL